MVPALSHFGERPKARYTSCGTDAAMTKLTQDMLALQTLLRLGDSTSLDQKAQIETLRNEIPAPILAHFLRQIALGRRGIALVRSGVCGECHIRLSHAMVHMLGRTNDLLVCETCGSFVALAPEEAAAAVKPVVLPKARRVKTPRAVLA